MRRSQSIINFSFFFAGGLRQTMPENGIVCPGEKLQYLCKSSIGHLVWQIDNFGHFQMEKDTEVNSTGTIGDFSLLLTARIMTESGSEISSTATNDMVASVYDDLQIVCYLETWASFLHIEVAGNVVL